MTSDHRISVIGMLRGVEGETRHVCWQCPECDAWHSEDYEVGLANPYHSSCGWTRHHKLAVAILISVLWSQEIADAEPVAGSDGG